MNDSSVKKEKAQKCAYSAKREEQASDQHIALAITDETGATSPALATILTLASPPMFLDPLAAPVKPVIDFQPDPTSSMATAVLKAQSPLAELAETRSLSPVPTEPRPSSLPLSLEEQCCALVQEEDEGIRDWLLSLDGSNVNMGPLRWKCEECLERAVAVKIHGGPFQTIFYPKCRDHATAHCFQMSFAFEKWVRANVQWSAATRLPRYSVVHTCPSHPPPRTQSLNPSLCTRMLYTTAIHLLHSIPLPSQLSSYIPLHLPLFHLCPKKPRPAPKVLHNGPNALPPPTH